MSYVDVFDVYRQLQHIRANQAYLIRLVERVLNKETTMAASIQDVLDKQAAVLKTATDALTLDDAIKAVLDGNTATIKDLQTKLDAAIASGNMDAVQQISDNMDAIAAAQSSDAAAKAILAGTPAGTGQL